MSAMDYAQSAYRVAASPHVETAIWAILAAIGCALVIIIAEMVKQRNAAAAPSAQRHGWRNRNRPKKPDKEP